MHMVLQALKPGVGDVVDGATVMYIGWATRMRVRARWPCGGVMGVHRAFGSEGVLVGREDDEGSACRLPC